MKNETKLQTIQTIAEDSLSHAQYILEHCSTSAADFDRVRNLIMHGKLLLDSRMKMRPSVGHAQRT